MKSIYGTLSASDSRIKKEINDILDIESLNAVRLLKPKKYKYKDSIYRDDNEVIGFIAHEVKDVIPSSVEILTEFIPNIYSIATVLDNNRLQFGNVIDIIPINTDNTTGKIRILDINDREQILTVTNYDNNIMTLLEEIDTEWRDSSNNSIFVFGQEVKDFNYLRKESIIPTTVSALQEVDRQLQAEKAKNLISDTSINLLETKVSTLESELATIKQHLGI